MEGSDPQIPMVLSFIWRLGRASSGSPRSGRSTRTYTSARHREAHGAAASGGRDCCGWAASGRGGQTPAAASAWCCMSLGDRWVSGVGCA